MTCTASAMPSASPPVSRTHAEMKERKQASKHRKLMKNSGALLNEFALSMIQKSIGPVGIKDFNFIASYNWRNSDEPMIFVPGISSIHFTKKFS
jgi:hypothetical protein